MRVRYLFGQHGEKEGKPYAVFLLVIDHKQLFETEFLSSFVYFSLGYY